MHAWQLVEALQQQQQQHQPDCCEAETACSNSIGLKVKAKIKKGRSSCSSSSKVPVKPAVSNAAALLKQRGLLLPGESVIIIGGGLTTAHLAALAAAAAADGPAASPASETSGAFLDSPNQGRSAAGKVSLLLRGSMRVKQFDVDIEWMGRNRGSTLQFGFRPLGEMQERLALMKRVLQVRLGDVRVAPGGSEAFSSKSCQ
jgi:hypothetical protein